MRFYPIVNVFAPSHLPKAELITFLEDWSIRCGLGALNMNQMRFGSMESCGLRFMRIYVDDKLDRALEFDKIGWEMIGERWPMYAPPKFRKEILPVALQASNDTLYEYIPAPEQAPEKKAKIKVVRKAPIDKASRKAAPSKKIGVAFVGNIAI